MHAKSLAESERVAVSLLVTQTGVKRIRLPKKATDGDAAIRGINGQDWRCLEFSYCQQIQFKECPYQ